MDYPNYSMVPEAIRRKMHYTGSLTGRDGLDVVIRFDAERVEIDGVTVRLTECILRMSLVVTWPDAVEQHLGRVTHHSEFTTVRYHCTVRPLVQLTEAEEMERRVAQEAASPRQPD